MVGSKETASVVDGTQSRLPGLIYTKNEALTVTPWWRVGLVSRLFNPEGKE